MPLPYFLFFFLFHPRLLIFILYIHLTPPNAIGVVLAIIIAIFSALQFKLAKTD